MTSTPAISYLLRNDPGIQALIGSYQGSPAIFPNHLPAGVVAYPVIIYSGGKTNTSVAMNNAATYEQSVSITCLARSYDAAANLANAVESALSGKSKRTVNGIRISGMYPDDDAETAEGLADTGDAFEVYQNEVVVKVWF